VFGTFKRNEDHGSVQIRIARMHKTVTNMTSTLGTSLQRVCSLGTATNGRNFSSERIVDFMMLYVQARPVVGVVGRVIQSQHLQ